ncbi:Vab2p KNAG_0L00750 [Huiozyma naganishii CBS 8797]|uniref:Uncharacterized protein n=1 Tax=Huiozyma naganishii (strain ATCC MYA-139 / BCRC 22969 / CBS 8797 / KCTC 17520 / NBRC 10181 / NCYC 3082 / Yp74L-3) TaxID=1071383 RepID=J7SB32_HUIN7|nr:hypothetical protein KNAG_0L00750 [Kazachstania naganishii CBS 8797]CCK72696.1 hypothetical protein KNAG_0L00750 [Kazachstania naganishii CBS 8797]
MKSKSSFVSIDKSFAYAEYKKLAPPLSSDRTTYGSIFRQVEAELTQVQDDTMAVFKVLDKDIDEEIKQIEVLELKLKSSHKKIKHSYSKTLKLRDKNQRYKHFCKTLDSMETRMEKLDEQFELLNKSSDLVLDSIVAANSYREQCNDPATYIMMDEFSKKRYPTLFSVLQLKFPETLRTSQDALSISMEDEIEQAPPLTTTSKTPDLTLKSQRDRDSSVNGHLVSIFSPVRTPASPYTTLDNVTCDGGFNLNVPKLSKNSI